MKSILTILMMLFVGLEAANDKAAEGGDFPEEINLQIEGKDHVLKLTGKATRSKFFVKIYDVAHYMEDPVEGTRQQVFSEIFESNVPKQFTLHWMRSLKPKQVMGGFTEAFNKILTPEKKESLSNEISEFVDLFSNGIKKGDETIFRWLPGGNVEVLINGEEVFGIENQDFAKGLWNMYLGPKSVVSRYKLISLITKK